MKLTKEEKQILADSARKTDTIQKGRDIITQGQRPNEMHLIVEGWACRYKLVEHGEYHITAFLIPGDICDIHTTVLERMDHSIRAVTPVTVIKFPSIEISRILSRHPRLAGALAWTTLVDEAILREWLVNAGTRPADKRLMHIFCEILLRSHIAGLTQDNSFEFPLTQIELGESLGFTDVHISRVLGKLQQEGLVYLANKRITLPDWERAKSFADFDPIYLHCQDITF